MLRVGAASVRPLPGSMFEIILQRMRELGYVSSQNLAFDYIDLHGRADRYGEAMRELVHRKANVIIAFGPEVALKSALAATDTIPIVMMAVDYDPIARGYIKSLSRPTGNVTGLLFEQIALATKRIQLLRDALPNTRAATVFWDDISADQWQATQAAAVKLDLRLAGVRLTNPPYDYERALAQTPADHRGLLILLASPLFARDRERLALLALRHRMASMFVFREFVDVGGLMSYGPNRTVMSRRVADYINRIARGAKPSDLPIEQPTIFELVINLKTAKALGITLSPAILLRADEVIE